VTRARGGRTGCISALATSYEAQCKK
jgi:hypothetical protein